MHCLRYEYLWLEHYSNEANMFQASIDDQLHSAVEEIVIRSKEISFLLVDHRIDGHRSAVDAT